MKNDLLVVEGHGNPNENRASCALEWEIEQCAPNHLYPCTLRLLKRLSQFCQRVRELARRSATSSAGGQVNFGPQHDKRFERARNTDCSSPSLQQTSPPASPPSKPSKPPTAAPCRAGCNLFALAAAARVSLSWHPPAVQAAATRKPAHNVDELLQLEAAIAPRSVDLCRPSHARWEPLQLPSKPSTCRQAPSRAPRVPDSTTRPIAHYPMAQCRRSAYDATSVLSGERLLSDLDNEARARPCTASNNTLKALRDADFSKLRQKQ